MNGYKKDMCLKEIGLCVQNLMTFLDLIVNILWGFEGRGGGDLYDCLMSTRIFTLVISKIYM